MKKGTSDALWTLEESFAARDESLRVTARVATNISNTFDPQQRLVVTFEIQRANSSVSQKLELQATGDQCEALAMAIKFVLRVMPELAYIGMDSTAREDWAFPESSDKPFAHSQSA
jgi:hypothetical protein